MNKITKKLIKYFLYIITSIIASCFLLSSIFLSKIYIDEQYNTLKDTANNINSALKNNYSDIDISTFSSVTNAVLIKDGNINVLGHGMHGAMPFLRNLDYNNLSSQGKFKNPMGEEFLYYKLNTSLGDLVVFQNNKLSYNYIRVVYITLLSIFILAILISVPLISYVGKKFTAPLLKLKKSAEDISNGNFNTDTTTNTGDEIDDLSRSLSIMATSLEKKYAFQNDFIANVSHDFKTPLSIIRNYSEAIYDDILDKDSRKEYSKEIITEVDRLNSLVMDVLQLSKLQNRKDILKEDWFELTELIKSCSNKFLNIAKAKGITINLNLSNSFVLADFNYIYRVLYNFIDNAIKFSNTNSVIDIFTTPLEEGLKVSIKNIGIEIDKKIISDIWNKYYKNSESGGIGLGLPICSEILKLHGFKYGVTSTQNKETIFYFIIPNKKLK